MSVEWVADHAHRAFKQNLSTLTSAGDANEATTRLRVINAMLFDVLGWDPTIVEAEKWTQAVGYLDYMFGPEPFSMVLEAKRDEINFVLPDKEYPSVPNAINLSSFPLVFQ